MRKILLFIIVAIIIVMPQAKSYAFAKNEGKSSEAQIADTVEEQLGSIDFSSLEEMVGQLSNGESFFGGGGFLDKVKGVINGTSSTDFNSFWQYIFNTFFDDVLNYVPILCTIVAICIICSFTGQTSPNGKTKGISTVIFFACFGVVIALVVGSLTGIVESTKTVLFSIKSQMEVIFPIMLVLLTAVGSVTTATSFQSVMGIMAGGIVQLFTAFVIPLFIVSVVFAVVGNLSPNVKLDKFNKFFSSLFKWIVGGVFTIFMAFVTIRGLTSASIDGVSIRTAKFALKSYVPVLGGYLSDGLNLIIASSVLVKNAVGATGLLVLGATVLVPIINIVVFSLGLKLVASVVEPLCDNKFSNFLYTVSNLLTMLTVSLIAVSFMYLVMVGLLICSGNVL